MREKQKDNSEVKCNQKHALLIKLMFALFSQDDEENQGKEQERVTPGKLLLTFEEQEKERQEQQKKQAEKEARRRLQEERKAFEEAKLGMVHMQIFKKYLKKL